MAKAPERPGAQEVPMEVHEPAELQPVYANHVVIAVSQSEFVLTFLQAVPPAILRQEEAQALRSIRATAVAKIILSPAGMERFTKVLIENVAKYQPKRG